MFKSTERACAWSGLVFVVVFGIGWCGIAGYVPPIPPSLSASEVAGFYAANNSTIKAGLIVVMFSLVFLVPFMGLITLRMIQIEHRRPLLTIINVISGTINIVYFIMPAGIWMAAAFRPERDAELIRMFNDFGWMYILWPVSLTTLQNFVIGLCILSDHRSTPLMPRWSGFFSIYIALLVIPGGVMPLFKSGPFAWNGLIAFYAVASLYFIWLVVMSFVLLKSCSVAESELEISQLSTQHMKRESL